MGMLMDGIIEGMPVFAKELVAGGVAGGFGKTAVAPLERVKILFQVDSLYVLFWFLIVILCYDICLMILLDSCRWAMLVMTNLRKCCFDGWSLWLEINWIWWSEFITITKWLFFASDNQDEIWYPLPFSRWFTSLCRILNWGTNAMLAFTSLWGACSKNQSTWN